MKKKYTKEQYRSGEVYLREVLGLQDDEIEKLEMLSEKKRILIPLSLSPKAALKAVKAFLRKPETPGLDWYERRDRLLVFCLFAVIFLGVFLVTSFDGFFHNLGRIIFYGLGLLMLRCLYTTVEDAIAKEAVAKLKRKTK